APGAPDSAPARTSVRRASFASSDASLLVALSVRGMFVVGVVGIGCVDPMFVVGVVGMGCVDAMFLVGVAGGGLGLPFQGMLGAEPALAPSSASASVVLALASAAAIVCASAPGCDGTVGVMCDAQLDVVGDDPAAGATGGIARL